MPQISRLNELQRRGKSVKGRWEFDSRHRLFYISEDKKQEFELEANLVAAEAAALVVSITEKQDDGKWVTGTVKIAGAWRANEKNQLEFEIERQSGKSNVLTFTGTWHVGESHEIIYTYRIKRLKSKTVKLETLTFKGCWDISPRQRLTYLVEGSSDSSFEFRGTFQTPSIFAEEGEIRYQLGAALKGRRGRIRTIILSGKWKLSKDLELSFEVDCGEHGKRELRFGAEYHLREDFCVAANLISSQGRPLGVEVVLTKEFLKSNAQAFLRLKKNFEESAVEAGVTIPW